MLADREQEVALAVGRGRSGAENAAIPERAAVVTTPGSGVPAEPDLNTVSGSRC
ncbi:hypothetical protein AB0903_07225 [Streptomyces sp. NPDC048389]|uniref:hypothetical protein n=1 Tax=Streptomyces sp. NPDC048389 TaxID=3154622 RepID=UPI0034516E3C